MTTFLPRILEARRASVEASKLGLGASELAREAKLRARPRDFRGALTAEGMSLIAEIKRASPSKGPLRPDLDPLLLADAYERGGARALSVLTEPDFFQGSSKDLIEARSATALPVLWKDFVVDPYQVIQARSMSADAVLVIVRILDDAELRAVLDEATRWEICPLVEVFDEDDLERALDAGADVIGINHRDLETFEEDPEATSRLRPRIPAGVVVVGESAITTREDVEALEEAGVGAILVGEVLVRADDPAGKIRELLGR